jgi:hypothetical protein
MSQPRAALAIGTITLTVIAATLLPGGRASASTSVCAGVRGCVRVASVDVDGDTRADQVGVIRKGPAPDGSVTVRVRTTRGHMTSTTSALTFWGAKPWFGAARIDGVRGSELVVGLRSGAHFQQFRVITYRSGRLVSLPAPDPTLGWGVDASYSSNIGLFRAVSRSGAVRLTC